MNFRNLRKSSGDLRKYSGELRKTSVMFGNVSRDLRRSSKYIGWPPAVFVLTSDIFVVICTRVTLFCTVLTKMHSFLANQNRVIFSSLLIGYFICLTVR